MITRDTLTEVGQIFKPHGIKGEMSAELDFGLTPDDVRCFLVEIDGIFVPFFVAESRKRGQDSWLMRFDGVNDEKQAATFSRATLYALTAELPEDVQDDEEDGVHLYDLEGYTLYDGDNELGVIRSIDDSTANVLFGVETLKGERILVPFADELVTGLDTHSKTITLELPQGLIDLN